MWVKRQQSESDTEQWTGSKLGKDDAMASLIAQLVKSMPAMQETEVQSLSWEDPLFVCLF